HHRRRDRPRSAAADSERTRADGHGAQVGQFRLTRLFREGTGKNGGTMKSESEARREIVHLSKSLFDRGYSVGTAGNISCLFEDGILITPTNSSLGSLDPDRISKVSRD